MSDFTKLRTRALAISTKLSQGLSQLSNMGNSPTVMASAEESSLLEEINSNVSTMHSLQREIHLLMESNDDSLSTSKTKQLQRSIDEFNRLESDLFKIKTSIQTSRDRLNLISDVRMDIDQHNTRNRSPGHGGHLDNDNDYYLQERQNVSASHNIMDSLISQVMETRDEIMRQRNVLETVGNRLESSISKIPGINTVLNRIDSRHRKNAIVITTVSLICLIILWFSF